MARPRSMANPALRTLGGRFGMYNRGSAAAAGHSRHDHATSPSSPGERSRNCFTRLFAPCVSSTACLQHLEYPNATLYVDRPPTGSGKTAAEPGYTAAAQPTSAGETRPSQSHITPSERKETSGAPATARPVHHSFGRIQRYPVHVHRGFVPGTESSRRDAPPSSVVSANWTSHASRRTSNTSQRTNNQTSQPLANVGRDEPVTITAVKTPVEAPPELPRPFSPKPPPTVITPPISTEPPATSQQPSKQKDSLPAEASPSPAPPTLSSTLLVSFEEAAVTTKRTAPPVETPPLQLRTQRSLESHVSIRSRCTIPPPTIDLKKTPMYGTPQAMKRSRPKLPRPVEAPGAATLRTPKIFSFADTQCYKDTARALTSGDSTTPRGSRSPLHAARLLENLRATGDTIITKGAAATTLPVGKLYGRMNVRVFVDENLKHVWWDASFRVSFECIRLAMALDWSSILRTSRLYPYLASTIITSLKEAERRQLLVIEFVDHNAYLQRHWLLMESAQMASNIAGLLTVLKVHQKDKFSRSA